jgi:hypothetical protein
MFELELASTKNTFSSGVKSTKEESAKFLETFCRSQNGLTDSLRQNALLSSSFCTGASTNLEASSTQTQGTHSPLLS